jgi:uncharacterized protein YhaN
MKIKNLEIDGFGVWHDLKLPEISSQLTVFYGANEAGKTTLMQFVRSVLYGFSPERRKQYLPPHSGGNPGGSLVVEDQQKRFRVTRTVDQVGASALEGDDPGSVTIELLNGKKVRNRQLREALENIDEATFNNVFAIGLDEIQRLGTLNGTQAAELIYRLTSGLDRVSLYDLIQGLRQTRLHLLSDSPPSGAELTDGLRESEMVRLLRRRNQLKARIDQSLQANRKWSRLAVRLEELEEKIQEAEARFEEKEHAARTVEIAVGLKTNWRKRAKISRMLRQLAPGIELPEDAIEKLDQISQKIESHRREADILQGSRHRLRDEIEQLAINEHLVHHALRIEALDEQRDWLQALERQSGRLEAEVEECEARFLSEQNRLSAALGLSGSSHLREISQSDLDDLHPLTEAIEEARQQLKRAMDQHGSHVQTERSIQCKLESVAVEGEQHGLPMDVQKTSDLVSRLRKRMQVEQRIEQAREQTLEMDQQCHALMGEQVLPLWLFGLLLGTFILGSLMVGLWLVVPESPFGQYGGTLAFLGVVGAVFSGIFKFLSEGAAAAKLDACQRQIDVAANQLRDADREKEALEGVLPMVDGSAALRLQAAERHLDELERMLPIETERQMASHEATAAKDRVASAEQKLASAMAAWHGRLTALGLPEQVEPGLFVQVVERWEKLSDLHLRADTRRNELDDRRREHQLLAARIRTLAEETGCQLEQESDQTEESREQADGKRSDRPRVNRARSENRNTTSSSPLLDQLDQIARLYRQQLARVERRETLIEEARGIKAKEGEHRRMLTRFQRRRQTLFESANCADEGAYRQLFEQQAHCFKYARQRKRITREIMAAIGDHAPEETFSELLHPKSIDHLEEQWEEAAAELQSIQDELKQILEEQGEIKEQRRALAEDCSLAKAQLELGCVDKQLADAGRAWRTHATVSRMLERIRADYEAHRQPETLAEASGILQRLTDGKYKRIWTPLANDILLVETDEGESLPVEALSRGTREQLLLSVRLALVALLARRGVKLPMVLDDVLVNFDVDRAGRAVEVLKQFAEDGHQLMLFTCHEHIWSMFRQQGVDCRRLPNRQGGKLIACDPPVPAVVEKPKQETPEPAKAEEPPPPKPAPKPKKKVAVAKKPDPPKREVDPPTIEQYHYPFIEEVVEV